METIPLFLSHITEDKALAGYLQARIRHDFLKAIDVFVSSDGVSIEAGSDWLQSLRSALDRAKCVVVHEQMRHGCRNCWVLAAFHFSTPPDDTRTTSAISVTLTFLLVQVIGQGALVGCVRGTRQ